MERHREIAPRLSLPDISTNFGFMLAPALALIDRHEDALALWVSVLDIFEQQWGHDVTASVWPEMALSYMALGRFEDARPLCDESLRTTADDDDLGQAQWYTARAVLDAHDGNELAVRENAAHAITWIDAMVMGGSPYRLRVEVAAALQAIGDDEQARVLALKSREQALRVGAIAVVRRANAVLARLPH